MADKTLIQAQSEWHGRIGELQALIANIEVEVVEAEIRLAEEITAVNAFEFKLRAGVSQMMDRLDRLGREIADLRKQIRRHYEFSAWEPEELSFQDLEGAFHEPRLDHNDYRFHSSMPEPPTASLAEDEAAELKRLYRQLARRFHPDMGVGEADRAHRTQMMMAINAAYAAGDLERLKDLALEPDITDLESVANDDEQLVAFLLRELARLQRRLNEIQEELVMVQGKKHYRLMLQARRAEVKGRDWLAEMKAQLQEEIAHKLVERDVLRQELELQEMMTAEESEGLRGEAFADAIWDISLDATFDLDPDLEAEDWLYRRKPDAYRNDYWDDDIESMS